MNDHLITPPPELVEDWIELAKPLPQRPPNPGELATLAARWGADQELEACCQVLHARYDIPNCIAPRMAEDMREWLRAARRPKPPSLKEQALGALSRADKDAPINPLTGEVVALRTILSKDQADIIRRALEQLDD